MQLNTAKRVHAFNPSRYECVFDVRLVLSGTVHDPWRQCSLKTFNT